MNIKKLEKTLRREVELLNEKIDLKIVHGFPYARDARRHKFLLSHLSEMNNTEKREKAGSGWFGRSMNFVSTFVL